MHTVYLPIVPSLGDPFIPFRKGEVVNYYGLLFYSRSEHMSILAKVLPRTSELELVMPT